MAHSIYAFGARWCINEDDLKVLTRDEVFDTLEDYEDALQAKQKTYAFTLAKKSDRETQYQYDRAKNALNALDGFWEALRNSSVEEFYIDLRRKHKIDKEENVISAFFSLIDNLLYKGTVILRTCEIEFTEEGAKLKVEEHPDTEPAYVSFNRNKSAGTYIYDTCRDYDEAVLEVDKLNRENRFFKCKECGKIAYIAKSDDEWKKAHDLQPVQRCYDCVQKRKAERQSKEAEQGAAKTAKKAEHEATKTAKKVESSGTTKPKSINAVKVSDSKPESESKAS